MTFKILRYTLISALLLCGWGNADPIITEFMASNDSELADEDGDFPDWIEVYNPDTVAVNMSGWYLTDDSLDLGKWQFPAEIIPAGGYLVVFASGKDRAVAGSELHTNFKLSSAGEYLALVKPDGVTKTSEFDPFPAQNTDISYGLKSTVTLVESTAPLSYVLATPANDGSGKSWTEHDYDDSAWINTRDVFNFVSSTNVPQTASSNIFGSTDTKNSSLSIADQSSPVPHVRLRFSISRTGGSSLQMWLRSPQGQSVQINPVTPEIIITQFNNENLNGTWTLSITENGGSFFGGSESTTLNSWSLEIPNGTGPATAGIGYDNGTDYDSLINTELPSGTVNAWVRFPFQIADTSGLSGLVLRLRYDQGFIAYTNGVQVASNNFPELNPISDSTGFIDFDIAAHQSALRVGDNVLAIRVANPNSSSSDMLLVPQLVVNGPASGESYVLMPDPTPGEANTTGALNPGPIVGNVTENPPQPADADDLVITATVQQRQEGIGAVALLYRRDYDAEISIAMSDDGTGGDAVANDGIYSATIPASASGPADMLRWRVEAQDNNGLQSALPLVLDTTGNSQSPKYYGTVVAQPSADQGLPIMWWFTQNVTNSRNRTGARASVFYEGKFYDNIYVRQRGGFTNNGSQKFDFNKGHPLYATTEMPSVGEINMNAQGQDTSFVRQPMGFQFHQTAGNPGCFSFPVNMRLNGNFDRVGILIEQVDEDYLKRYNYDHVGGELYKFVQRSNLNPVFEDVTTGVEKKTGDQNDLSSLQSLVNDLKQSDSNSRITSFYDNIDQQEFINYMAIRTAQQQLDDVRKNFYMFKDSAGDGRWRIFPWDLDYTWDSQLAGNSEERVDHPFYGTYAFRMDDGNNQWNRLYDVAFEDVTMRRLMLRRLRTLMDSYMKPDAADGWFEARVAALGTSMAGLSGPSASDQNLLVNSKIPERRNELFNIYTSAIPGLSEVIPAAQPSNPAVMIDEVDFNPASGDQDQEYIRLTNAENTEIDISGWTLSSGVAFTFPAGTVIPRNGEIFVSPNLSKFVTRSVSPTGAEKRLVTGPYQGHLSSFGEDIILTNDTGGVVQTFGYAGDPSLVQQYLKIIQIHYAPLSNPDAEFIELMNTSNTETIGLTGVRFINGIDFDFTGSNVTSLAPQQRVLVVKNIAAFESVYGTLLSAHIAGEFANATSLNNGGEAIKLDDATGSTIASFTYDDAAPWPYKSGHSILFNLGFSSEPPPTTPDPANPAHWYLSGGAEGEPLGASALFRPWLTARGQTDPLADIDGWSELLTYALGRDLAGDDFVYRFSTEPASGQPANNHLILETSIRASSDVDVVVQTSTDLVNWFDESQVIELSSTPNGDGTIRVKYQVGNPISSGQKLFARLIVRE